MSPLDRPDILHQIGRPRLWIVGLVLISLLGLAAPALAATTLVYNGTLDLSTKPSVDYTLVFGAGTAVTVALDCIPNVPENPLDPAVAIYGPNGFSITDDDNGFTVECELGNGALATFVAPAEGLYTIRAASAHFFGNAQNTLNASGSYRLTIQIEGTYAIPSTPGQPWNPGDDRLNGNPRDQAAPVAIYPDPLQIYVIDPATGQGLLVLGISADQIDEIGVPIGANVTLGETVNPYTGQPILVSRLTTGEFQVNTADSSGNPYVVIWDSSGNVYYPGG
jgi:hypothetical protein